MPEVPEKVVYALCEHLDQSKDWLQWVPGADRKLKLDIQPLKPAAVKAGPLRLEVKNARLLYSFEAASAVVPFAAPPFFSDSEWTFEVKLGRIVWRWSCKGANAEPSLRFLTASTWGLYRLGENTLRVEVTFYSGESAPDTNPTLPPHELLRMYPTLAEAPRYPPEYNRITAPSNPNRRAVAVNFSATERPPPYQGSAATRSAPPQSSEGHGASSHSGPIRRPERAQNPGDWAQKPVLTSDDLTHQSAPDRPYFAFDPERYVGVGLNAISPEEQLKRFRNGVKLHSEHKERIHYFLRQLSNALSPTFRGVQAAAPQFSEPKYHKVWQTKSTTHEVVEFVVELEGVWQRVQPELPQGHQCGEVFDDRNAVVPAFTLPGAGWKPKYTAPVHVLDQSVELDILRMHAPIQPSTHTTWRLCSRTGIEISATNRDGTPHAFAGAFRPIKTTWTAVSSVAKANDPLMVVHFVDGSVYTPQRRDRIALETQVFSPGRRATKTEREGGPPIVI
ncbi:hypothetical protein JCM10908_005725 [Rhodotorula pacifica]|uniref:uncharacterized protein n=1 Tax=Rhodotorula pacifica TaxID=1495444 RepID=UPI00317AFE74